MNAPGFLLAKDAVTIQRQASTVDSEGNSIGALTTVYAGRGTVFVLSDKEVAAAGVRLTLVDAGIAVPLTVDVEADDQVTVPQGSFVVVSVEDRRLYRRALVRRVAS